MDLSNVRALPSPPTALPLYLRSVVGLIYGLAEDLHKGGVDVSALALLCRVLQHALTLSDELDHLASLFSGCDGIGGATLSQVGALCPIP